VRIRPGARPAFLGGAIAPGPALLARALAEGTARLPLVQPDPGAAALGRDTEAAVRAGVSIGFRGAARELALRVAREAGLGEAPLVVTGGARAFLLGEPLVAGRASIEVEDLVHVGLLVAALELDAWVGA
jgi:type III pantothenate kinase